MCCWLALYASHGEQAMAKFRDRESGAHFFLFFAVPDFLSSRNVAKKAICTTSQPAQGEKRHLRRRPRPFLSQCFFHVYAPSARLITPCMESAPGNTRDCVLGRLLRFPPQQLWAREGYVAPICTKQVNCKMHVVHIQSHLQSSSFFFERSCAIERFNR